MRGLALALLLNASCARYPGTTVGITAGAISLGACEIDGVKTTDCLLIGAISGVALGAITALVVHFLNPNAPAPVGSAAPPEPLPTFTPPPIGIPADASVAPPLDAFAAPASPPSDAAPLDAAPLAP